MVLEKHSEKATSPVKSEGIRSVKLLPHILGQKSPLRLQRYGLLVLQYRLLK